MSIPGFGVRKPVPVNLLMIAILLAGITCGLGLRREFFPEVDADSATVTLTYPGAAPEEIEETLAIKVEDALADLDEVDELTTTLAEGGGGLVVTFRDNVRDIPRAVDELERAVDALTDLPEESERIVVRAFEPSIPVIRLSAYGEVEELLLKRTIRAIADELRGLKGMGDVVLDGVRDYEISVEFNQAALIKHGLSLPAAAAQIRAEMAEIPGGTVRSHTGNVKVRTLGVAERAQAIRHIVLRAWTTGETVQVGEVATVRETFVDEDLRTRFNGQPGVGVTVLKLGDQDIVKMAEMVRAYVAGRNGEPYAPALLDRLVRPHKQVAYDLGVNSPVPLPRGIRLATSSDYARFVEGRLSLLTRNALQGFTLVFATLLFFLNWRAAFWVAMGLTTAIAGTLVLMFTLGVTLNLLTMFGLILVIGLLVDDGIVVSENIQQRHDQGEPALVAATRGAEEVFWPVVATVLTSIVAFLPLKFIQGRIGDLMGALPAVVMCSLSMSLIEALLILPSHMGHTLIHRDRQRPGRWLNLLRRFEQVRDRIIYQRVIPAYGRVIAWCLHYRYVSVCIALCVLLISVGLVKGGRVRYTFIDRADAETVIVDLRMPIGTPIDRTSTVLKQIEAACLAEPEVKRIETIAGQRFNIDTGSSDAFAPHVGQMFVELALTEERDRLSSEVIAAIRRNLRGKITDIDRLRFSEISGGPGGPDITLQVRGHDLDRMDQLVRLIKTELNNYDGVFDVADDNELGQRELQITLKPGAAALGFTVDEVARQVRGALYGIEAHVYAANREDIEVRVRLDEHTRRSQAAIEQLWLITPSGQAAPLSEIASVREGVTYAAIKRVDRLRNISVTADVDTHLQPERIVARLPVEQWRQAFPDLHLKLGGRQEQERDAFNSLPYGFAAAAVMIYVILAWLFSSYIQPIAVMLAIPFSLVGAILGHGIMGFPITFLSIIGFVALSGVVVNDSLILVEFFNRARAEGASLNDALVAAGKARLRAIILTSLTTIFGLMPLMLEQSFQARFMIPMAISISFGLASATLLILFVLPCIMVIVDDMKAVLHFAWHGRTRTQTAAALAQRDLEIAQAHHTHGRTEESR